MSRAIDALVKNREGELRGCTGICAVWCPNHGYCTCPIEDGSWINVDACAVATGRRVEIRLHATDCPLHAPTSLHAT